MDRRNNRNIIIDFCSDKGVKSIIIDGRDQVVPDTSDTSKLESFNFGVELPKAMLNYKIAVVHKSDDDSLPYIKKAAVKRGATIKSFQNMEKARAWIESVDSLAPGEKK